MNEAKNLLHFEFPSQFFQVSAIDMVPNHINLRIAARINTLRKIGEGYKMDDLPPQDRIKTIYIKLIHSIDKQGEIENQFSNRELRILSYGLHYKSIHPSNYIFGISSALVNFLGKSSSNLLTG